MGACCGQQRGERPAPQFLGARLPDDPRRPRRPGVAAVRPALDQIEQRLRGLLDELGISAIG
ncbi:hypothetical protein DEJ51_17710 [Streptomyces venezuelae]|uniref:Uncharacterized protein n=1 Tax=Streptomyces venezuelae TaxID=54571 RepID=A0A5P2DR94_STRVZ|nr:hypothetical protein DEJ51_17710 [Streptomyces venezuelae]